MMSNKMISALMVSLVLLVWALALPVAEADRKVSQQTDVTQVSVQLFSELDEISWPVLAYQRATSSLPSEPVGGGLRPWKLVEGDFNEDGHVDLVTIYRGANVAQLSLRFGDGRGGFAVPHRFDLPAQQPVAVALGDVNLDGHLDVVLAYRDATAISVLEGTGDGAFQSTKMYEVGSTLQSLALADVDRDGYEDALVACETPGCLALLRGDGRGFEQPLPLYTWPDEETPAVKAMRAADVDGDGLTDVILALEREVVLLSAARAYEPVSVVSSESEFTAMTLGDFNADESMDVVVAQAGGDMMVLLGDRQGGFLPPRILSTGWRITAMTAAHLNEDGYLDLAVVRADRAEVTLLLGDAHGGFKAYSRLRVESQPVTIMASRLNKDALADLVIAQREGDAIALAMSTAAAIVVNTTRDAMDVPATASVDDLPGSDGLVSLREAIVAANNTPGPQDIVFHIPRSDPGFDGRVFRLELTSALPQLRGGGTVIDGSTQTPFTGDTNPAGPEVVLDGSSLGVSVDGFTVTSSFNVIRGFVIGNFSGSGVKIVGRATGNIVAGNFIGTDETGAKPRPNQFFGVLITGNGSQANVVGGTAPEDRNVISGNEN
ncbi:MAG: VCBS repeat-containing protein, partial [Acidobacteria bacterium]